MKLTDMIAQEMEQEAVATRRVLERVPEAKLGWKPHGKSMSLGELAMHVATTAGNITEMLKGASSELPPEAARVPSPSSKDEVLKTFDDGLVAAKKNLAAMSDADAQSTWKLTAGGKELFSAPKIGVLRMIVLNHSYHHRGQLSVYLRLLDVPLPSIYGPSADENPFGM